LKIPRLGCVNVHSGRLPAYRGMLPTFWQMLRGERAATVTVHFMADKLDVGDVLATKAIDIQPFDSLDRVIRGAKREGARLLMRVLLDLQAGRARASPINMRQAGYFSFPNKKDVQQFRRRGYRLL